MDYEDNIHKMSSLTNIKHILKKSRNLIILNNEDFETIELLFTVGKNEDEVFGKMPNFGRISD